MSICTYGGKKLIPAPFVSIQKVYQKSSDGTILGAVYSISVTGKILADKGSPNSSGTFWTSSGYPPDETVGSDSRLGTLIRKREAIESLFKTEGKSLEWQSSDGSQPMKCNPRVVNINFNEGNWFNYIDYNLTFETDVIYINGTALGVDSFSNYLAEASESWSIDTEDTGESYEVPTLYRVNHTVSATGKRFYDETGSLIRDSWENARNYVMPKLGFNTTYGLGSGVLNIPSFYNARNLVRTEQLDKIGGNFSVTETWILASGTASEDYNIDVKRSLDSAYTTVSINGNINGFIERDNNYNVITTKYDNANTKWTSVSGLIFARAQSITPLTLNPKPISESFGVNKINGVINYSYEYDTRPTNIFTDVKSEVVSINQNLYADTFAVIPVLGRVSGPVLQGLGSRKEYTRALNVELVLNQKSDNTAFTFGDRPSVKDPNKSELLSLISQVDPRQNGAAKSFVESQNENWDIKAGRYTYNINWIYEA